MTTRKKIVLGGLGALTPVVLNLIAVDLRTVFYSLTLIAVAGYLVRVIVLFYLGGLVAYLHKAETSPIKLFELGIVAPALITSMLNASNISVPSAPPSPSQGSVFVPSAYAQPAADLKQFTLPQETPTQQFFRGFAGSTAGNVWFVISGYHEKYAAAAKQAEAINKKAPGLGAEVYAPYGQGKLFSVVIGANLTREEADRLKKEAVKKGLPKDTVVWTFPQ
ncbi:MAG: hypothetical protein AABZ10_00175 [Nitrospirota bacterium]